MRQTTWCFGVFVLCAAVTSFVDAQEFYLVPEAAIDPVQQPAQVAHDDATSQERYKRKLLEPVVEVTFGIKHNLLDLIFGKVNQLIDFKTGLVKQLDRKNIALNKRYGLFASSKPCDQSTTVKPGPTTTEDVAQFDSTRVQLDLPAELYGTGYTLITEISTIVGNVIFNTAERTQNLLEAVKPMIGRVLGIKLATRRPSTDLFRKPSGVSSSGSSSSSSSSSSGVRATRNSERDNSVEKNPILLKSSEDARN